jgi:hypothetical protein
MHNKSFKVVANQGQGLKQPLSLSIIVLISKCTCKTTPTLMEDNTLVDLNGKVLGRRAL